MRQSQQKLTPADELLCHQMPETFASIAQADISWTEKLWGALFARDGSLQVDVGFGKYHNRNVFDAFGGISRGREQLTVRSTRPLDADPERVGTGPLDHEVLEPLKSVRFALRENHVFSGLVNSPDGSQRELHGVRDELKYDPVNRRLLGGKMTFDAGRGDARTVEIEPASDTGSTWAAPCTSGSAGSGTASGAAPASPTASASPTRAHPRR